MRSPVVETLPIGLPGRCRSCPLAADANHTQQLRQISKRAIAARTQKKAVDRFSIRTGRYQFAELYKISNDLRSSALLPCFRKISESYANCRERSRRATGWGRRRIGRTRNCFRPCAEDFIGIRGEPGVIAKKCLLRFKKGIGPGIVGKCLTSVGGTREGEASLPIRGIVAAIVELHIYMTGDRIYRHPLEELIDAVMCGIAVHPDRSRPGSAMVSRFREKHVYVAVSKIAPAEIQRSAAILSCIHSDLRKSHYARNAGNASCSSEVRRSYMDHRARGSKGFSAVVRLRE